MAEFPALPLFTDAIIADTTHLTNEEFGVYMRLLMHIWRTPGCKIPAADAWVMRKMGCDNNKFNDLVKPLISEFLQHDRQGNWLTQKRLSKEFEFVKNQREKNTEAAKSRWNKEKTSSERNAPTPTPTSIPIIKESIGKISFSISEQAIVSARKKAPGWDVYALESKFKGFVATKPENPDAAFLSWVGKFTKGKLP